MLSRLPFTIALLGGSITIAIVIGVLLGVIAAHKRGTLFDTASVSSSLVFYSLPTFWMGMIFILIFTVTLGWFPHAGAAPYEWATNPPQPLTITTSQSNFLAITFSIDPSETLKLITGYLRHAFLPMLTLVLFQYGGFLLLTRATMLEVITEDYIVTAKAKGVDDRTILLKHALKNASLPLITSAALAFGFMFGGAMITEAVYTWPGLGRWIFEALAGPDYFILQAAFYVISVAVILANFLADLLYGVIDPRIRYG
jgi:peptide/nickel transport system permease protein